MEKPFPAYRGEEPYVFVCYAHEDADVVYPELQRLHNSGLNIWYDEGISPGHEWNQNVADSIDGSAQFLFFVSPSAVASRHCRNEAQYALDQEKALVSVYLAPTEVPGGLKLSLGSAQAIMKHEMSADTYQRKMSEALKILNGPGEIAPEPAPTRASPRRSLLTAGLVAVVLVVAAGIWWDQQRAPPAPAPSTDEVVSASTLAIAVLPFVNMSNDPEQEFFSDGVAEDILNGLARNNDLTVRPRSSTFKFKGPDEDSQSIGRQLNVTHVVEGSVRRAAGRVRVSVQLIEVAANRSVWSERYDRDLDNVFAVQDAITQQILEALSMQFAPRQARSPTISREAYDAFLHGRYYYIRGNFGEAERWLETAVERQPQNADAWALYAQVNANLSAVGLRPNSGANRDLRRSYIERSLSIDPNNVTALANRALMDTHYIERNYQGALDELIRLNRLHPNNEDVLAYLSMVFATFGKADMVHRVTDHLIQLSPFSAGAWYTKVYYGHLLFGPEQEASAALAEMERLGFSDRLMEAQFALTTGGAIDLGAPSAQGGSLPVPYTLAIATEAYLNGDYRRAHEIVAPLKVAQGYTPYFFQVHISLLERDLDSAFASYRNAILEGEQVAISMVQGRILLRKAFPEFYDDPRYEQLLQEFRLDRESVAKIRIPHLPFLHQ